MSSTHQVKPMLCDCDGNWHVSGLKDSTGYYSVDIHDELTALLASKLEEIGERVIYTVDKPRDITQAELRIVQLARLATEIERLKS